MNQPGAPLAPEPAYEWVGEGRPGDSPLVIDSPHSWRGWPAAGTRPVAPPAALDSGWDAWVDELWSCAVRGRAPVLAARFHRAFIDANRASDDVDLALLAGPWPGPVQPSAAGRRGMGLIRRLALPDVPMYASALSVAEVQDRLDRYYHPYHEALAGAIDAAHRAHGLACHIDCHSMKSVGNRMNIDAGQPRPDMVVSDLEGQSCDPFLLRWVTSVLRDLGYRVQVNHPYRGAELVRRHGRPDQGRHSLQIEINRALYMDEARCERHAGFDRLAADLGRLVDQLESGLRTELYPGRRAPPPPGQRPAPPTSHPHPYPQEVSL